MSTDRRAREFIPFLCFFVLLGPQWIYLLGLYCYCNVPHIGECGWILFIKSTDSNANFFMKHSRTHMPRYNVLPAFWASLSPVKMTHKIYHHTPSQKYLRYLGGRSTGLISMCGYLATLKLESPGGLAQHRPIQPTDSNRTRVTRDIQWIEEESIKTTVNGYDITKTQQLMNT